MKQNKWQELHYNVSREQQAGKLFFKKKLIFSSGDAFEVVNYIFQIPDTFLLADPAQSSPLKIFTTKTSIRTEGTVYYRIIDSSKCKDNPSDESTILQIRATTFRELLAKPYAVVVVDMSVPTAPLSPEQNIALQEALAFNKFRGDLVHQMY